MLTDSKELKVYVLLLSLVICGLIASIITAIKIVHFGALNFPFCSLVFSILTYPIVDCICELWGKQLARFTMWIGLACQMLVAIVIQLSVMAPHAATWQLQSEYQTILSSSITVVIASLAAFASSQILDIFIFQRLKEKTQGKMLWLRSNVSTYAGQALDSLIFINLVFFNASNKFNLFVSAISIKIMLSLLMTPVVYLIIISINHYLNSRTLAFKPI